MAQKTKEIVMKYQAIVAMDKNGVIGVDGEVPWHKPHDLAQVRRISSYAPVVVGRKTYESIYDSVPWNPSVSGPLQSTKTGRRQIILTKDEDYDTGVHNGVGVKVVNSYKECKWILNRYLETKPNKTTDWNTVSIFGGAEIYDMFWGDLDEIWLTMIYDGEEPKGDLTYFPRELRIGEEWSVSEYPISKPCSHRDDYEFYRLRKQ